MPDRLPGGGRPEPLAEGRTARPGQEGRRRGAAPRSDDDTAPVRPDEQLDREAVGVYLRGRLPGADAPITVSQFPGGHSNLTYLLRFGRQEYVLRRPPFGPVAPKAHDMAREHRVLSALWRVFPPAPRPYLLCEDPSVIGASFYVMERRHGLVVRTEIPPEIGADPGLHRRVSEAVVDTLVALHAVDWAAAGLAGLGHPAGFVERQVRGWAERYERAKTREIPAIRDLARWLGERIPPSPPPTLLHNDFKLDNLMLARTDPGRVAAVLDWEMATLGDPLVDLGLLLCYWADQADPPARRQSVSQVTAEPGFLTRAEVLARYGAGTGRDVSHIAFYETFALYKVAVVVQQIYVRYHRGQTRDARFATFEDRVVGLAEAALQVAERSGL
ncbi:MAG: phosphotransferase family protein [Candidatus Rokubacteria bacterium]|nr:phosphotransferase family protein [Candidatus Rokubacteria bacterium]